MSSTTSKLPGLKVLAQETNEDIDEKTCQFKFTVYWICTFLLNEYPNMFGIVKNHQMRAWIYPNMNIFIENYLKTWMYSLCSAQAPADQEIIVALLVFWSKSYC